MLLTVFGPLNPSPITVSPFAGQPAGPVGVLVEMAKGTPRIYALTTNASTAAQLVPSNPLRRSLLITVNGTDYTSIGTTSAVTAATGFVIPGNATLRLDRYQGEVWAIAPSAKTNDLRAWEDTAVPN